jgi:hypothetical protein
MSFILHSWDLITLALGRQLPVGILQARRQGRLSSLGHLRGVWTAEGLWNLDLSGLQPTVVGSTAFRAVVGQ